MRWQAATQGQPGDSRSLPLSANQMSVRERERMFLIDYDYCIAVVIVTKKLRKEKNHLKVAIQDNM